MASFETGYRTARSFTSMLFGIIRTKRSMISLHTIFTRLLVVAFHFSLPAWPTGSAYLRLVSIRRSFVDLRVEDTPYLTLR